jgi:hypothetical protein
MHVATTGKDGISLDRLIGKGVAGCLPIGKRAGLEIEIQQPTVGRSRHLPIALRFSADAG